MEGQHAMVNVTGAQQFGAVRVAPAPTKGATATRARKQLARWARALYRFLAFPFDVLPPARKGRWPRIALAIITLMAIGFVVFNTVYAGRQFDAYVTNAEDMGIMDQALWTTTHGALLHQTICNSVTDTNCLGDISRFSIHFEPIMLVLALLYLVAPSVKALLFIQMLVVATGAYPAYWIASRRLASPLAGICFVAVYLTFPALQDAVRFDFHAVTFTAALLLFALYFMLTRNNVGLIVAAVLAMATKEEIPLDVIMIGLAIVCFQRRWRLGIGLIALACAWLAMALLVMHAASPLGHSPTASRYAYLGSSPLQAAGYILTHPIQLLRDQILGNGGARYLQRLLSPDAYLAILSPQAWLLALPTLMINLLSSDPNMHNGIHQYSVDVVPFMIFATISSVALLVAAAQRFAPTARAWFSRVAGSQLAAREVRWSIARPRVLLQGMSATRTVLPLLLLLILVFSFRQQQRLGNLPGFAGFYWPVVTPHVRLASEFIALIPPDASVCAQDRLVPHLSHRRYIYQYPYMAYDADYVFLDAWEGPYPFPTIQQYNQSVQALLSSGRFEVVAEHNGYILLKRLPAT
jgi:uncharacterized membrane protein